MLTTCRAEYRPGSRVGYVSIEAPSTTFLTLEHRNHAFRIEHPANWRAQDAADGLSVTIAPEGGVVDTGGRKRALIYGMIVHAGAAFPREIGKATSDLVGRLVRANPMLKRVPDWLRSDTIGATFGLTLVLSGPSAVTGEEERVTVIARELRSDQLLLAALIAPAEDYGELKTTFDRMIGSLRQL